MIIHGNDVLVTRSDGVAIAGSTACDITAEVDLKEIAPAATGAFTSYVPGLRSWTVRMDFLVFDDIVDYMEMVGQTLTLNCKVRNGDAALRLRGSAICKECVVTATLGNLCRGSFTFQGTGELVGPTYVYVITSDPFYIVTADNMKLMVLED